MLWATGAVLFTRIPVTASAPALNLGKNATGALLFVATLLVTGGLPHFTALPIEAVAWLAASGFIGMALCDNLLLQAFRDIGPRRVNIVMVLSPLLVGMLALLPPLLERPGLAVALGMVTCLGGILLAVLERPVSGRRVGDVRRGLRYAAIASVLQAVGIVLTRLGMQAAEVTVIEGATIKLLAGFGGVVLLGTLGGRLGTWVAELKHAGAWRAVAGAALLGTYLGIGTNQAGIAWSTHVGVAATLNALTPLWLIPLSAVALGEGHDRWAWISALLAVAGIALMTI